MKTPLLVLLSYGVALPAFAADETSGNSVLGLLVLVALAALAFSVWHLKDWIEAKADEATQRARKMKLENDKLELELDSIRDKNP